MFGQNPVRKQHLRNDGALDVVDIFPTIQGEGPFAGQPAIFIRLFGCNLRCSFCDTDFEHNCVEMSVDDIAGVIKSLKEDIKTNLIVITGGEPFRQNIVPLVDALVNRHWYHVQIETAGTIWPPGIERFFRRGVLNAPVTLVCSPKTAKVHDKVNAYCVHWKYIIRTVDGVDVDGLPIADTQATGKDVALAKPPSDLSTVYLQPCDEHDEDDGTTRNIARVVNLAMWHDYRVSLQQHKYLGVE